MAQTTTGSTSQPTQHHGGDSSATLDLLPCLCNNQHMSMRSAQTISQAARFSQANNMKPSRTAAASAFPSMKSFVLLACRHRTHVSLNNTLTLNCGLVHCFTACGLCSIPNQILHISTCGTKLPLRHIKLCDRIPATAADNATLSTHTSTRYMHSQWKVHTHMYLLARIFPLASNPQQPS